MKVIEVYKKKKCNNINGRRLLAKTQTKYKAQGLKGSQTTPKKKVLKLFTWFPSDDASNH